MGKIKDKLSRVLNRILRSFIPRSQKVVTPQVAERIELEALAYLWMDDGSCWGGSHRGKGIKVLYRHMGSIRRVFVYFKRG